MSDRKRMRRLRIKRVSSVGKRIEKHYQKIQKEKGRKDTTKDYWRKEIDRKFLKQIKKDKEFLDK